MKNLTENKTTQPNSASVNSESSIVLFNLPINIINILGIIILGLIIIG